MKIENKIMLLSHLDEVPTYCYILCHAYRTFVFLHMCVLCSSSAVYSLKETTKKRERDPAWEIQNQPQTSSLEFKFHESHHLEVEKVY